MKLRHLWLDAEWLSHLAGDGCGWMEWRFRKLGGWCYRMAKSEPLLGDKTSTAGTYYYTVVPRGPDGERLDGATVNFYGG